MELNNVELVCIDCLHPQKAIMVMQRCLDLVQFKSARLFTHDHQIDFPNGIRFQKISKIDSLAEYSLFCVKILPHYIETDYILIVQTDGYILDSKLWENEFLNYDYIGAPWGYTEPHKNVGNGGFSLRSKKFLNACLDPFITDLHPEDDRLCRNYRPFLEEAYQIKFAPQEVAHRFSQEPFKGLKTFGFHG